LVTTSQSRTRLRAKLARVAALSATFFASLEFCAPAVKPVMPRDGSDVALEQFWAEPNDIASVDTLFGPWGRTHAPDPHATYVFAHDKAHGASPGMTVTDPEGRKWSIKQSAEGPVEVMHSRILSALGYHQPPVYFLPSFTLRDQNGRRAAADSARQSASSKSSATGRGSRTRLSGPSRIKACSSSC
jgi:hypothetical protein